jgi:23S rRNA (pseudouridine1915-N3)-methyltransferase
VHIELWVIGATADDYIKEGIAIFDKRINRYVPFRIELINSPKKWKDPEDLKRQEAMLIQSKLQSGDRLILLDEKGREESSRGFAQWLQKQMNAGPKRLVFVVGGAYGFSPDLVRKAQGKISLSKMTFSHQMVRLFFVEQLYRAFSILNNEPYHND